MLLKLVHKVNMIVTGLNVDKHNLHIVWLNLCTFDQRKKKLNLCTRLILFNTTNWISLPKQGLVYNSSDCKRKFHGERCMHIGHLWLHGNHFLSLRYSSIKVKTVLRHPNSAIMVKLLSLWTLMLIKRCKFRISLKKSLHCSPN